MSKEIPKYEFSDDYLVYCAMYILDIKPGTFAHLFLNEKVRGIRTEAEKKRAMTYAESCDWIKKLVATYEQED